MTKRVLARRRSCDLQLEISDGELKWTRIEYVPQDLLDRLASARNQERRAPMGDSHGSWVKVAEIPLSLALQHIPMPDWEDRKAWKKLLDDPDYRAFRTDGNHRKF
jgi:hypothetical protein